MTGFGCGESVAKDAVIDKGAAATDRVVRGFGEGLTPEGVSYGLVDLVAGRGD
jgi:hypothetical protein